MAYIDIYSRQPKLLSAITGNHGSGLNPGTLQLLHHQLLVGPSTGPAHMSADGFPDRALILHNSRQPEICRPDESQVEAT